MKSNALFLGYFQDHLPLRFASFAEFLRFSCLAQIHRFKKTGFKCALFDEPGEFRQISRATPHDHLDSVNSGPFGSRFIDQLNRRGEHPALFDDSIGTCECLSTYQIDCGAIPLALSSKRSRLKSTISSTPNDFRYSMSGPVAVPITRAPKFLAICEA
jgi:hypothetical protein